MDICSAFADRLAAEYGIHVSPADLIADGQRHRITPDGDRRGSKAMVYILHDDDRPVGWFEYHKTGDKASIKLGEHKPRSPAELAEARKRWAEERARQEAELAQQYADRAAYCAGLWSSAGPADGHPYLTRKGITAPATVRRVASISAGDFTSEAMTDVLLVPLFGIGDRKIASIQAILPNGDKRFAANARTAGTYHPIRGTDLTRVLVCEGYATGYALAQVTGHSVVCAMSANRLEEIARWVAQQGREVVICADNDHGTQARRGFNPGIDAGRAAAAAIGARCIWPRFDAHDNAGTDWDDWLREGGDPEYLRRLVSGEEVQPAGEEGESARQGEEPSETLAGSAAVVESASDQPTVAIEGQIIDDRKGSAYGAIVSWSSLGLEVNDKGVPHANLDNAVRIIQGHPELTGRIWLDEFTGRIHTDWPTGEIQEWTDAHDNQLNLFVQRILKMHRMGITTVQQAVNTAAFNNRRNELVEWLTGLQWDAQPRLEGFMAHGFGAAQNDYTAAVGRCWLISMVASAFQPGCKVDTMPVFEGVQGKSKSTALNILGGKWYAENNTDVTSKDFIENIQGVWLVEIAEMHAFGKAEVERIKSIITCRNDRYRAAYARRSEDHKRRCVFAGTTNRNDWNRDETGARRFWPVACTTVELDWITANRDQLFAEAVALYRAGTPWWDIPVDLAKEEQDKRRAHDAWDDPIAKYLETRHWVTVGQVLEDAVRIPLERQDLMVQRRVGSIMRAMGWEPRVRKVMGKTERGWVPPDKGF